jgi:hypothetical protein
MDTLKPRRHSKGRKGNGKGKPRRVHRKPSEPNTPTPGESRDDFVGREIVEGLGANAVAAWEWSSWPFDSWKTPDALIAVMQGIARAGERVNGGNLGDAEALLTAQGMALNAMFVNLSHRANVSSHMEHFECYMRLALKAQSQCRATCESLAVLKNPPIFARQANIASQQVVNNGTLAAGSRAREIQDPQTELLEAYAERLDEATAGKASGGDSALVPVAPLDRAADGRREGTVVAERLPWRPPATSARTGAVAGSPGSGGLAPGDPSMDGGEAR